MKQAAIATATRHPRRHRPSRRHRRCRSRPAHPASAVRVWSTSVERRTHATSRRKEPETKAPIRTHQGVSEEARQEHGPREGDCGPNRQQTTAAGGADEIRFEEIRFEEVELEEVELEETLISDRPELPHPIERDILQAAGEATGRSCAYALAWFVLDSRVEVTDP